MYHKRMMNNALVWEDKYSVGVELIDDQHKMMFNTINQLIALLRSEPKKEQIDEIVAALIAYKKFHFATEEKYFDEFKYEGTAEHKEKHLMFSNKLDEMVKEFGDDSMTFAFKLVDFLEDWLIDHLMDQDQKYVQCFKDHGLS